MKCVAALVLCDPIVLAKILCSRRAWRSLGSGSNSDGEAGTRRVCGDETGSKGHPQERQRSGAVRRVLTRDRVPPARSPIPNAATIVTRRDKKMIGAITILRSEERRV